jgi:hypothetical protein
MHSSHQADEWAGAGDGRAESLIVVDARSLGEIAKDPVSLVPFQRVIGVELVSEKSFVGDNIGANGRWIRSLVLLVIKAANSSSMARN